MALVVSAAWGQAPTYSAAGIVNNSDWSPGPFAPNSVVSLFGANLSFSDPTVVSQASMNGDRLPTQLGGVSVLVDNSPAPLLYVDKGQIVFLVPSSEIPGNSSVQVVRQSVAGPPITIALVNAAPALFASNGYALAQDYNNNYAAVTPNTPAHAGDAIILYATGLGYTQPSSLPGEVPATAANVVAAVQVLLNGAAIDSKLIFYAGVTPGCAGLYQINFIMPGGFGGDTEIRVSTAGQTSAAGLKIAVR